MEMGKLYIVIYVIGKIGGTVGPLPYDITECEHRVVELLKDIKPTRPLDESEQLGVDEIKPSDLRVVCEYHDIRPQNEFPD
jgi:hypothetical protein